MLDAERIDILHVGCNIDGFEQIVDDFMVAQAMV